MRKMLVLAAVLAPALIYTGYTATRPGRQAVPEVKDFPERSNLPGIQLTDPNSPFFSRQVVKDASGKVVELRVCYRDKRRAVFAFNDQQKLKHVTVLHPDSDNKAFEAWYDEAGARITEWKRWRQDTTMEKTLSRQKDREVYTFYRSNGIRQQVVEVMSDGVRNTIDYSENGTTVTASNTEPALPSVLVVAERTVKGVKIPRLTVTLNGAHIAGWQHVDKDGNVDHTAQFEADGCLLFSFHKEGKLVRQQRYEVAGEDWQRQYYVLREGMTYFPDGKTINHLVKMHTNGMHKEHRRYDDKGRLEAIRNFTPQMQEVRMEEFDPVTNKTKSLREWSAEEARRGFVPDGVKGSPDFGDPEGPIYDFGGVPYMEVGKSYTTNPLFRTK